MPYQVRAGINAIAWTPEGRRCLTGTNAGEFTLWQGQHFGFETILQVTSLAFAWACHASGEAVYGSMLSWQPHSL